MTYRFKTIKEKILAFVRENPKTTLFSFLFPFLTLCVTIYGLQIQKNGLESSIEKERISSFESRIDDFLGRSMAYEKLRLEGIERIQKDKELDVDGLAKETRRRAFIISLEQLLTDADAISFLGKAEYIEKLKEEIAYYDSSGSENLDPKFFDKVDVERERLFNSD